MHEKKRRRLLRRFEGEDASTCKVGLFFWRTGAILTWCHQWLAWLVFLYFYPKIVSTDTNSHSGDELCEQCHQRRQQLKLNVLLVTDVWSHTLCHISCRKRALSCRASYVTVFLPGCVGSCSSGASTWAVTSRPYTAHSYIGDIFIDRLINHRGASIFHEDWGPKYEGGRAAHRPGKAESGVGFLERGQPAPLHQLGGLGSALSSPSGVWGGATAEIEFGAF